MMHLFFLGLLLGWGAAVPIGAVNLEITRRNLRYGTRYGLATGVGACLADLTCLCLLALGLLALLKHHYLLNGIGILGGLILLWIGISALRTKIPQEGQETSSSSSLAYHFLSGYGMTIVNPYTILFWIAVSAQVSAVSGGNHFALFYAGAGLLTGTFSWVLFLNLLLRCIRHRLSDKLIHRLNLIGGVIVIFIALGSLLYVVRGVLL